MGRPDMLLQRGRPEGRNVIVGSTDPTHEAWIEAVRPAAERMIAELWTERHRFAFLDYGPRRLSRKGRSVATAGLESDPSRIRAFYDLRHELSRGLADGTITEAEARARLACLNFALDLRIAASPSEAIEELAGLFVRGGNAVIDSQFQDSILWISTWRE